MGFIAWILAGALTGWIVGLIDRRQIKTAHMETVFLGIIGALLGGWIATLIGIGGKPTRLYIETLVIAIISAVGLLSIVNFLNKEQ